MEKYNSLAIQVFLFREINKSIKISQRNDRNKTKI